MTISGKKLLSIGIGLLFITVGCAQQQEEQTTKKKKAKTVVAEATAVIHAAEGEDASGTVTFERTEKGTRITANLNNLSQGKHGFHIHQWGDCSNMQDLTSAGGHYNPTNQPHGAPTSDQRHVGDMGNIPVGPEGNGDKTYTDPVIKLNGKDNVIGRAVIIHAGEDDLESQPSGNAGPRIGCGVIGISAQEQDTVSQSM